MMKSDADVLKGLLATSGDPKEVYVILDWADVLPKKERVRPAVVRKLQLPGCQQLPPCRLQHLLAQQLAPVVRRLRTAQRRRGQRPPRACFGLH